MIAILLERWWEGTLEPLVRAAGALVCALAIALATGPLLIRRLREGRVHDRVQKGDSARLDELSAHKEKTPTLGGLFFFGAVVASIVLWCRLDTLAPWLAVGVIVALGGLGLVDDLAKLRSGRKGISARAKLAGQIAVSLTAASILYAFGPAVRFGAEGAAADVGGTVLFVPVVHHVIVLGWVWILLATFVTTGASNAVNLTDGLDGLAVGCSLIVAGVLALAAFAGGEAATAGRLAVPHVAGAGELGVVLAAVIGGGFGFLWFNCHPARVFMGDTGALPLGGLLGFSAVFLRQEVLLAVAGGVLVVEALSVILQVASFKLTGRRIFKIAPLHHHFQFGGLRETQITVRFWLTGAVLAVGSLVMLRLG